jgi:AraC family transcriptional activator FtrA
MVRRDFRQVAALAYDRMGAFELGIVSEVFGLSRPELDVDWYRFSVFSLDRRPLRATGGVRVEAPHGVGVLRTAGTIVISGWHVEEPPPERLLRLLRAAHAAGARLVSICSGVFALAATGLLDGKRATTHWRYAARLASRYPGIRVESDRLYIGETAPPTLAFTQSSTPYCLSHSQCGHNAEYASPRLSLWSEMFDAGAGLGLYRGAPQNRTLKREAVVLEVCSDSLIGICS